MNKKANPLNNGGIRIGLVILGIMGTAIVLFSYYSRRIASVYTVSYNQFRDQLEEGNVDRVVFSGQEIKGEFERPFELTQGAGERIRVEAFRTYLPPTLDDDLLDLLLEEGVGVETLPGAGSSGWMVLVGWLPLLLIGFLAFLFLRRLSASQVGGGEGLTNIQHSRAKAYDKGQQKVTFMDVAGLTGVKQELEEVIEFLQNPQKFQHFGATVPKGVLLAGPPGTGKTLLARAVAGEADASFFAISGSDFMEIFVGVGASRVRDLFKQAKDKAPAIIFIDELDSIGRRRGAGLSGGHEEREQTLNQLLAEMDGFEKYENIIVMAATNRPDVLDAALLRPGRFDRQIVVDSPTLSERLAILKVHGRNKPFSTEVDLAQVARGTPGFSGADLANLLNESALLAIRRKRSEISTQEINDAADKILMGLERELVLTEKEKRLLAYHEAGHALLAALLPHADPIHKVNIIPRGRSMGVTQQLPERDRYLYEQEYILDRLAVLMGGRAAEELAFGTVTSGAADDLKQATRFARKMVLELGMGAETGHISLRSEQETSFLGDDWAVGREYSELTAQKVDQEISQILETAYGRAKETLERNRASLDRVVEALVEREELLGPELIAILQAEQIPAGGSEGSNSRNQQVSQPAD